MNPTIQFTVTPERRKEIEEYAREKGFRTASDLARYATVQHMRRYPASGHGNSKNSVQAVQPEEPVAVAGTVTEVEVG